MSKKTNTEISTLTSCQISIQINPSTIMFWINVPKGFKISKTKLEGHYKVNGGFLKSLSRNQIIKQVAENCNIENIEEFFKNLLLKNGWDFEKYDRPYCYFFINKEAI